MKSNGLEVNDVDTDERRATADLFSQLVYIISRGNYTDGSGGTDFKGMSAAAEEFYNIDQGSQGNRKERLMEWADKYLSKKQRENMLSALRQRKRRAYGKGTSITISDKAHRMITFLAEVDGLTISETLEKRLNRAYRIELKRKYE